MRYKTRKLIFPALAAILISLLFTCVPFGPPDDYEDYEDEYTDVQYSSDGSSVTIYLDGSVPVRQSRALTKNLAMLGHDLFEVVFYHPATNSVARAVWETGHAAGVNGVARNVNYALATAYPTPPTGGNGAAILFVGKKSDRTLLAVGKLAMVDDKPLYSYDPETGVETPITPVPLITPETRTVTFAVAALRAGVSSSAGSSSFKTNSKTNPIGAPTDGPVSGPNTDVINVLIGRRPFPLFNVTPTAASGRNVKGEYRFEVVTGDFEANYRNGILQKSVTYPNGTESPVRAPEVLTYPFLENVTSGDPPTTRNRYRIPRYPIGGGVYETLFSYNIQEYAGVDENTSPHFQSTSTGTRVQVTNVTAANANLPFNNPVEFTIGPTLSTMNGRIFAFSFQIPVYPLTNADSRASGFSWYLRPGYDPYRDDLDDGVGGSGGAILIGTGTFPEAATPNIYIKKPPNKTKYQGLGDPPWNFTIEGLEILKQTGTTTETVNNAQCFFIIEGALGPSPEGDIALKTTGGLNDIRSLLIANNVDGIVTLRVEYYETTTGLGPFVDTNPSNNVYQVRNTGHPPTPYFTTLNIYYFDLAGINFNVPDANRFAITDYQDFTLRLQPRIDNLGAAGGTILLAVFKNYNMRDVTLNGNNFTIILVAGSPDIVIGKSGANVFNNNGGTNTYYFGIWPFDEILTVRGMAFDSQPFYINPGGTFQQALVDPADPDGAPRPVTDTLPPPDAGYFVSGTSPGPKNVNYAGVKIFSPTRLYSNALGTGPGP